MSSVRCTFSGAELRVYRSEQPTDFEDYVAAMNVTRIRARVCMLSMFCGKEMGLRAVRAIAQKLSACGYDIAIAERAPTRKLPFASVITEGPLAGMWQIDLKAAAGW
jgi:hypothetical protein